VRQFKLSNDPQFAAKLHEIVGLYVDPPTTPLSCRSMRRESHGEWIATTLWQSEVADPPTLEATMQIITDRPKPDHYPHRSWRDLSRWNLVDRPG